MAHVQKICIDSFRGIRSLELSKLSGINIITGDNNCGKTSVLEVMESFRQPDDIRTWRSLIRKSSGEAPNRGMTLYEGFCDLFDINSEEKHLKYTITMDGREEMLEVLAKESEDEMLESKYNALLGVLSRASKEEYVDLLQLVTKIEIEILLNGECMVKENIYEGQRFLSGPLKRGLPKYKKNITYISPSRHAEGNIFLNQVLDHPDLYEEMLMVLKEYDSDIISINYDNESNGSVGRGVYKILSKAHKKALPLNVYGDGMKKAILLMSAVIQAKDGILLLDEFETAIHTSAMNKTFKWILETCKRLNVQVLMTSHSKEAIDKVLKCAPSLMDDMAVYTMYKEADSVSVRRLEARKAIEAQDEMGLELR